MPTAILMPQLGMNMTEGTIVRWLVDDGTKVSRGQTLLEFETDKVTAAIEAPADGILQRTAPAQTTVPVRTGVGYILSEGEARVVAGAAAGIVTAVAPPAQAPTGAMQPADVAGPGREVLASPIARRLAAEHGIDLAGVTGSGPAGRISEADVQAALAQRAAAAPAPSDRQVLQRIPLAGRRRLIAERMRASLAEAAQLTVSREVDVSELAEVRQSLVGRADELGVRVSYDALFAKALATALGEEPALNAVVEGDAILVLGEIHMAVAVASDEGLVVPVVRDAAARSLVELAEMIEDFGQRAQQGRLLPEELAGGTVTITNLGGYGVEAFTPILNPPQSAILGIGRIAPRPAVVGGKLAVVPTVHLSLTWDHRVADGVPAARLLGRLVELIQDRRYLAGLA